MTRGAPIVVYKSVGLLTPRFPCHFSICEVVMRSHLTTEWSCFLNLLAWFTIISIKPIGQIVQLDIVGHSHDCVQPRCTWCDSTTYAGHAATRNEIGRSRSPVATVVTVSDTTPCASEAAGALGHVRWGRGPAALRPALGQVGRCNGPQWAKWVGVTVHNGPSDHARWRRAECMRGGARITDTQNACAAARGSLTRMHNLIQGSVFPSQL